MRKEDDNLYSDVFKCSSNGSWHDRYYVNSNCIDEKTPVFTINRAGIDIALPKTFYIQRSGNIPCYLIMCILSGHGELKYNHKVFTLKEGNVLLLPAHTPHEYVSDPKNPMGVSWVEFYGSNTETIFNEIIKILSPVSDGATDIISEKIAKLLDVLCDSNTNNASVVLYDIIYTIYSSALLLKEEQITPRTIKNLNLLKTYIDVHISDHITNAHLATLLHISIQHLLRLCKREWGTSPQNYIMRCRVQKSMHLLLHTDMSEEQIAEKLGFCNTGHMIKRFKEQTGVTPYMYRKENTDDLFINNIISPKS